MNIAVLGADGRSGQAFVRIALESGHNVRGGYRSAKPKIKHPNYTPMLCDGENLDQVAKLISGCEAVVSLIGHVKGSRKYTQTESTKNIVTAMKKQNISRLVSLTGTGARFNGDEPSIIDKLLNLAISLIDSDRINDGKEHVKIIQNSQLEWSILRVLKLQNTKFKNYRLSTGGPAKLITSRQEVADACMNLLESSSFINQAPIISKP